MTEHVRVEGLETALKNLNGEIDKLERKSTAADFAAGLLIQRESQKMVPVEYGNLRGSAYTRKAMMGKGVEVGYTASYALFVHENLEQKLAGEPRASGLGVYWGPNGRPQFLTAAIEENMKEIIDLYVRYTKVRS